MRLSISTKLGVVVVASGLAAFLPLPTRAQAVAPVLLSADGSTARIDGEITPAVAADFAALAGRTGLKSVSLNSPGGRVFPALDIARAIKAAGLNTVVPAGDECHSACAFIFLAGHERIAQGKLGVHQVSGVDDPSLTQTAIGRIYEDLVTFNAPSYLVSRMLRTPPGDMYVFTPEELERNSINIRDASKALAVPHLLPVETWLRQSWLVGVFVNTHTSQPFVALESNNMMPLLRIAHYPQRSQTFVEIMVPEGSISGTSTRLELRFAHGNDDPFSLYVNADIETNAYAFDFPTDPVAIQKFWAAFATGTQLTVLNSFGVEVGRYSLAGSRRALDDFFKVALR
ncbi:hypothetical protein ACI2J4_12115 [Agrobacterium tumefaciens]|uniref:Periplasmic protein-like protein n=1 Tax=Agrobacterium tumefaciens TaxID=358 RepID=A0A176XI68_AGRTU|nr:hypothetical protein [Agrobacterium tumefaciens]OAE49178.1 hypothetical protein A7J57_00760 [Agrobacterium tumefaciens]